MALPASDNFNRANGGLGTNWTTMNGYSAPVISSNVVTGSAGATNYGAYWNADAFGNDQYAQGVLTVAGGEGIGPAVRDGAGTQNRYFFWVTNNGSTQTMYKVVSGSLTQIGATYSETVTGGDTVKLEVSGTTLTPSINASAKATRTDSSLSSGSAGLIVRGTVNTFDDFEADDVGGGGGTTINVGVDNLFLTEQTANINAAKNIAANVDNLTLSELAANINAAINVNANVASLTLTEFAAAIKADTSIAANVDTLTLTTFAASLGTSTEVSAGVANLTLSELAASINAATHIQAAAAGLTLTEYQASVNTGKVIQANVDALTLTELQAAINAATNVQAGAVSLSLTELAAGVSFGRTIQVGTDVLTLSELQAAIKADRNIEANADALSLSTYQALVDAGLFDGITIDGQQSVSITQNYGSLVIYSNKRNYYTL